MPPRHAYWTIIFGDQPTAFRSATPGGAAADVQADQAKHPDAVMMWFARGKLWQSPEAAREALERQRRGRDSDRSPREVRKPPERDRRPGTERRSAHCRESPGQTRQRDKSGGDAAASWRPGGAHRDPRDRFKVPRDVKRRQMAARVCGATRVSPRPAASKPRAQAVKKKDETSDRASRAADRPRQTLTLEAADRSALGVLARGGVERAGDSARSGSVAGSVTASPATSSCRSRAFEFALVLEFEYHRRAEAISGGAGARALGTCSRPRRRRPQHTTIRS